MIKMKKQVIHITPDVADLIPNRILHCLEENCSKKFSNTANLNMHLIRHHQKREIKLTKVDDCKSDSTNTLYFCPVKCCIYNESSSGNKYFVNLKYIRQHYQKVHAEKQYNCEKCNKKFLTLNAKNSHENICGQNFKCQDCDWTYTSREAILTHCKRKNHRICEMESFAKCARNTNKQQVHDKKLNIDKSKILLAPIVVILKKETKEQTTQTQQYDESSKEKRSIQKSRTANKKSIKNATKTSSTSTNSIDLKAKPTYFNLDQLRNKSETITSNNDFTSNFDTSAVNVSFEASETTMISSDDSSSKLHLNAFRFDDNVNSLDNFENPVGLCNNETQTEFNRDDFFVDQMYSNMYTQTCDDFLSELGLSDIQTQTNWSEIMTTGSQDNDNSYFSNYIKRDNVASTGPHDELLVSTETQTSFTQCLLDSEASGHIVSLSNNSSNSNSIGAITQYTQTCDLLSEGLFGGQENDLIANFQSTHTQT